MTSVTATMKRRGGGNSGDHSDLSVARRELSGTDAGVGWLATFNYIYGANGTGKTTISRLIADQGPFPFCSVDWTDGAPLDALVYNTDYVEANFNLSDGLKGVFTLGEDSVEAKRKIGEANAHLEKLKGEVAALRSTLSGPDGQGGKLAELTRIDSRFAETCWRQKQKHDGTLK